MADKPTPARPRWQDGTPPTPGWYVASDSKDVTKWRWWNGKYWSHPATAGDSPATAAAQARKRAKGTANRKRPIQWSMYYPPNARVKRVGADGVPR